jgi:hypothetical protein
VEPAKLAIITQTWNLTAATALATGALALEYTRR